MTEAASKALAELVSRIERNAWHMGELWEKYQGKGWPDAEGELFTNLRDVVGPSLRAQILSLSAEPVAVEGWQPIETAPKDGTEIDVYTKEAGRIADVKFSRNTWRYYGPDECETMDWAPICYEPTHWMPLPSPPKETP